MKKTVLTFLRAVPYNRLLLPLLLFIGVETMMGQNSIDIIRLQTTKSVGEDFNISIEVTEGGSFTIEGLNGNDEDGYTIGSQTIVVKGNIESLTCYKNDLTQIDLSACHKLKKLDCRGNKLTTLDASSIESLQWLACNNNNLTMLNITNLKHLSELYCHNNNLKSLQVETNAALTQ